MNERMLQLIEGALLVVVIVMLIALGSLLGLIIVEFWRLILR